MFTLTPPEPLPREHAPPAPAFTPEQLRRIARLKNRDTLYEAEIVRADGARVLLAYCRKSGSGLREALRKRTEAVVRFLGGPKAITWGRGTAPVEIEGGGSIRFSGRTERDAIVEGELPYVGNVP